MATPADAHVQPADSVQPSERSTKALPSPQAPEVATTTEQDVFVKLSPVMAVTPNAGG